MLLSAFAVLQLPYVQNRLFEKLLRHISHTTQFTVTHHQFQLKWLSQASVTGLTVQNAQGSNILAVERVALTINPWQQLQLLLSRSNPTATNLQIQASNLTTDTRHFTDRQIEQVLFVSELNTSLSLASGRVVCQRLMLRTQRSVLQGDCVISYDASAASANFYDSSQIRVLLSDTLIASEELALFVPYFKHYKATYSLSGTIEGRVNNLHLKDFQFGLADQNTYLKGDLSVQGLPDLQATVFDVELQQGDLKTKVLLPYIDQKHHHLLAGLASIKPQGHIYGKLDDFTAQASFDTDLGKVSTDLKFKIDAATQLASYKGGVSTQDFELGKWLNTQAVQQVSMQGQIDGKGLSLATAHFQLEATIDKLGWNNYDYKNIYTNGAFAQAFFQGKVTVDDPNLQFQAEANIDLNKDKEHVAIQGALEKAHLQALRLAGRPVTLHTKLSIALQGLSLDNSKIDAQLSELRLSLDGQQVQLDALQLRTDQSDLGRSFMLDSVLISLKAEGDFAYTTLVSDFKQFIQSFQCRLTNTVSAPPQQTARSYSAAYQIDCKDINPLLHVFRPDVYIAPGSKLEGSFVQGEVTNFCLKLSALPSLAFKQHQWKDTQLTLRASRTQESVSATAQLAAKQQWGAQSATEDLGLAISWNNDCIDFDTSLGQSDAHNQLRVQGHARLLGTAIELALSPTSIKLSDHEWHIHPENRITVGKSWVAFKNFEWVSAMQQITLEGVWTADPSQVLHLKAKNFSLDNLTPLVNKPLSGELNATAVLRGTLDQPRIDSDIMVEQFTVDNSLVGDLHVKTSWENALNRLGIEGNLDYLDKETVAIQGFYEPLKKEDGLSLLAHFSQAQLAVLEPLVGEEVSQLTGELTGTLSINGSPASPRITGTASIENATVRINYLQALYQVHGELTFLNQLIHIDKLNLTDDQQGQAMLRGKLVYTALKGLQIDLRGRMTQFKLIDTASGDNKYFYGTGIASGDIALSGPISCPAINIKATTNVGTHIYIPVRGASNTIAHAKFVRFVNNKWEHQAPQERQVTKKGIKLDVLLDITPDALVEIMLDADHSDSVKGRGRGQLRMGVDTQGVLGMSGGFEFSEGEYNFSLYRIVNKTFKILPQSKIIWADKPLEGVLDIKAAYEQRVSLTPLLRDIQAVTREKYPIQVVVSLRGALLLPEMAFRVNFLESPSDIFVQTAISDFQRKSENKLYLEGQVMSLVVFKEFSEGNQIVTDSNVLSKSLSDFISSRLNNFASGLDKNLEIETNIDLEELGSQGTSGVRLKLSRHFLDGKIRISREGGLGIGEAAEISPVRVLGDWAVEYLLMQDGRLKAKFYNKQLSSSAYLGPDKPSVIASGGISLLYTKSFNSFLNLNFKQWWGLLFRSSKKDPQREAQ